VAARSEFRILYVHEAPVDHEAIRRAFDEPDAPAEIAVCGDLPTVRQWLQQQPWDLLITDHRLAGEADFAVLDCAQSSCPQLPVLLFTACGSEQVAAEAIRRGAAGYVIRCEGAVEALVAAGRAALRRAQGAATATAAASAWQLQAEQALKSFFDGAPFQMGISEQIDDDMILVAVNPAAAASIGLTPEQARGKRVSELGRPGPRRGVWLEQYNEALQSGRPVHFEQCVPCDGDTQWWAVTLAHIGPGPSGRPRFSYVVQDVTERKRDEHRQAALHRISEAAQAAPTLPELFRRIHEIVGELLPARNLFVALYDEDRDELSFPYYVDEYDTAPATRKLDDGTLAGRVVRLGHALLFTPDTPNEGVYEERSVVGTPSMDWLGVPLKVQDRTIGALAVQSYGGDVRYTGKDKSLLEFVSGQVAAAVARKQAEAAIAASETRFRLLFEQNLAGVFRSLPDGRMLDCNDAFAHMFGYGSRDEIIRVNARALYFEDADREHYVAELSARGAVNHAVTRLRRKDGSELWGMVTSNLIRDESGGPAVLQGTLIDFTDYRHAQEALVLSESRLEQAQRVAHLGSWNWDLAAGLLSWSDELCRIFGVDPDTHVPGFDDFLARVHVDDRDEVRAVVRQARQDRQAFSHELRVVRPSGEVRTLFNQGEVIVDDGGTVTSLAGACLDITARKMVERLERDRSLILEQVAQNRPLKEVIAHISQALEHQRPGLLACVVLVKDGCLHCTGAPAVLAPFVAAIEGMPVAHAGGSFGRAARSGEPVLAADISRHPDWTQLAGLASQYGIRSCWSYPVLSADGSVLGVLNLIGREPGEADGDDLQLLESASRLAAVAIEHRELTERLSHQAQHDALTGLPNRLLFQDRLGQALAMAERHRHQVAVLYMDLDRFKFINDTLGHSSGDALLALAARRLDACIRKSDTLARLGGDEFTVVLTELNDSRDAMRVAGKLIEAMREPFNIDGRELYVSVSMGISLYPEDGTDCESLMVNADVAMYRAKDMGRDGFQCFAPEMNTLARERMELESQLRHSIEHGELSLAYQPQCDAGGRILALEALMRWRHPTLGMVPPSRFIPLAEESGLIVPLGEWALREACARAVAWRRAGHPSLCVSVNVSAVQFRRDDWVETVRRALRDTGLEPEALELEITESLLLQSVKETSANLFELRALGVGVAIDDFGTGYSSLSYLHRLPITTLKIDQSFVCEIGNAAREGHEEAPIIRTIIALAHNLGMTVVAEGVETEGQRALLQRLGCERLQGYLLHRPLSLEQVGVLLDGVVGQRLAAAGRG
jgi:diguanylate cyclase (GGDEF)-like protein/PAS domain S-box-containing protein